MNISIIEQILREFANYFLEVGGVVLISSEGHLITSSIGIEENTTLLIAGILLQVSNRIAQECQWQKTEQISLQAKEGFLTLLPCTEEAFILIKTNCIPSGNLGLEIQRIIIKLEAQLNETEFFPSSAITSSSSFQTLPKPAPSHLTKNQLRGNSKLVRYCKQELVEYIGPIANIVCKHILKQNPELSVPEFVEALAEKIPNLQQAQEFREKIYSWQFISKIK